MQRKTFLVLVGVVVVLVAVGLFFFPVFRSQAPAGSQAEALADEVTNLDLGNLDAEFEAIDAGLNQL